MNICDVWRNLVPFVQFKKREKHHGEVLLLVKFQVSACNFTKRIAFHHGCFSHFLNCTSVTESRKAPHIAL